MANILESGSSNEGPRFVGLKLNILAVDADSTSLANISAMLKAWNHQVVTATSAMDALSTIRGNQEIDLVLTDIHMPGMNGLQLLQHIKLEFNLPVVIISLDDRQNVMMECLTSGASMYLVKPLKLNDLKNVWQYAVATKRRPSLPSRKTLTLTLVPGGNKLEVRDESSSVGKSSNSKELNNASSSIQGNRRGRKRKSTTTKRGAKVIWTTYLHNRFLGAIKYLGLPNVEPKKILEHLKVPDLTTDNVARHLQKYRNFLRSFKTKLEIASKGSSAGTTLKSIILNSPSASWKSISFQLEDYQNIMETRNNSEHRLGFVQYCLLMANNVFYSFGTSNKNIMSNVVQSSSEVEADFSDLMFDSLNFEIFNQLLDFEAAVANIRYQPTLSQLLEIDTDEDDDEDDFWSNNPN